MIQSITLPKSTNSKFASLKKAKPQNESLTSLNPPFFRAFAVIFREATLSHFCGWLTKLLQYNWVELHTWNAKCPIFLGNFTPKTSNYCLKNRALGFPGTLYCAQTNSTGLLFIALTVESEPKNPRRQFPHATSADSSSNSQLCQSAWDFQSSWALPMGPPLPWEPTSFIFRVYNPCFGGVKPSFFMGLGSKGSWWFQPICFSFRQIGSFVQVGVKRTIIWKDHEKKPIKTTPTGNSKGLIVGKRVSENLITSFVISGWG